MIALIIIQLIAVLFAISMAKHDGPAVTHFEEYGFRSDAELKQALKKFHFNNWLAKFFFCCVAAVPFLPEWNNSIAAGLFSFLWIYLLFDPVLNANRPNRKWHYLGYNDRDGKIWLKLFGKNAGKLKALILFSCIVAVNIIIWKI